MGLITAGRGLWGGLWGGATVAQALVVFQITACQQVLGGGWGGLWLRCAAGALLLTGSLCVLIIVPVLTTLAVSCCSCPQPRLVVAQHHLGRSLAGVTLLLTVRPHCCPV
jgi:hypothetical protein